MKLIFLSAALLFGLVMSINAEVIVKVSLQDSQVTYTDSNDVLSADSAELNTTNHGEYNSNYLRPISELNSTIGYSYQSGKTAILLTNVSAYRHIDPGRS